MDQTLQQMNREMEEAFQFRPPREGSFELQAITCRLMDNRFLSVFHCFGYLPHNVLQKTSATSLAPGASCLTEHGYRTFPDRYGFWDRSNHLNFFLRAFQGKVRDLEVLKHVKATEHDWPSSFSPEGLFRENFSWNSRNSPQAHLRPEQPTYAQHTGVALGVLGIRGIFHTWPIPMSFQSSSVHLQDYLDCLKEEQEKPLMLEILDYFRMISLDCIHCGLKVYR